MKFNRYVLTIVLALLISTVGGVEVLALNTFITTESLSENDMEAVLKNINITTLIEEPPKNAIECFDVNEDGIIAVGHSNSEEKTVCIYTSDGLFEYGYSFKCLGSFGIELDENILIIYLVRSDIAVAINSIGEIASVTKIQNTTENNSYWNDHMFSTTRKIGDTEYYLKNDMGILNLFASSYSQLISINENGEESIIYDVNSAQLSKMTVAVCSGFVFVCLVVATVIWWFVKQKHAIGKV